MANNSNKRFSVCGVLRKQDAIELLKNNLNAEELKKLIQPNYTQLIRVLKSYTKKELQYLLYNTEKIGLNKITATIRNNAVVDEHEEIGGNNNNNAISITDSEEEEEEINTNADLLLANITGVKKMNETAETQTDNIKQLEQLQLGYIEDNTNAVGTNAVGTKSVGNKKETQYIKPTSFKKKTTTFIPQQKDNEKLVISNDPILNNEIEIEETAFNTTAQGFMKTDAFNELKKHKSLKKVVSHLKTAGLSYGEVEKVVNTLADFHKKRILNMDRYDSEIKSMVEKMNKASDIYELFEFI